MRSLFTRNISFISLFSHILAGDFIFIFIFLLFDGGIEFENLGSGTQGKNSLKLNSSAYEKYEYEHLGRWYIKVTFWEVLKLDQIFQKSKVVTRKTPVFVIGPFCSRHSICLKGTLIQIWKFANIFVFAWKWHVENFTLKHLLRFEICTCEICEKFVYKHSETIE